MASPLLSITGPPPGVPNCGPPGFPPLRSFEDCISAAEVCFSDFCAHPVNGALTVSADMEITA